LNGAILGMTKWEIKKKFDEIVDFAGIEKYIDTPVKRYSSGMYVRLAFAVAAHVEPEILIVDEVLAVGDAEFQKKCLGKMNDVSKNEGRTVLFVSHNMAAVKALCETGIVLNDGKSIFRGSIAEAVNFYQNTGNTAATFEHLGEIEQAPGNKDIRILKFEIVPLQGETITISSGFTFKLTFFNNKEYINLDTTFELRTLDEIVIFHHGTFVTSERDAKKGVYVVEGEVPAYLLNSGVYKFKIIFGEDQRYALLVKDDFIQFEIENEMKGSNAAQLPGFLQYKIPYKVSFEPLTVNA